MSNPAAAPRIIAPNQISQPRRHDDGAAAARRQAAAELALHAFIDMDRAAAIVRRMASCF